MLTTDPRLVLWPASGDQVQIANFFGRVLQIGIELLQVRNGYSIGRRTAGGVFVEGTDSAIKKELETVFEEVGQGQLWKRLKRNVEELSEEIRVDSESGLSWADLLALASA